MHNWKIRFLEDDIVWNAKESQLNAWERDCYHEEMVAKTDYQLCLNFGYLLSYRAMKV